MKILIAIILLFSSLSFSQTLNNCKIMTQNLFGATNSTTLALPMNAARRCLYIQNASLGTSTVYLRFGASTFNFANFPGLSLSAGTMWAPIVIPMNAIYISSNSVFGTSTMVMEGL